MTVFKAEVTELLNLRETISDQDLEILLIYLSRDQKLLAYDDDVCIGSSDMDYTDQRSLSNSVDSSPSRLISRNRIAILHRLNH